MFKNECLHIFLKCSANGNNRQKYDTINHVHNRLKLVYYYQGSLPDRDLKKGLGQLGYLCCF